MNDIDLITDLADNIARIIIDLLAADGCAGHLDAIATPEGKITTDTQARNDAVAAEEVRQKAKILTPILDPLRVRGY
jgi:hypothetical protein